MGSNHDLADRYDLFTQPPLLFLQHGIRSMRVHGIAESRNNSFMPSVMMLQSRQFIRSSATKIRRSRNLSIVIR